MKIDNCISLYTSTARTELMWLSCVHPWYMQYLSRCLETVHETHAKKINFGKRYSFDLFGKIDISFWNHPDTTKFYYPDLTQEIPETLAYDLVTEEIVRKHNNIAVFWSGGVDSTFIVANLIKNGLPKERLFVLCSFEIFSEYKEGFKWLIDNGYNVYCLTKSPENHSEFMKNLRFIDKALNIDCYLHGNMANNICGESNVFAFKNNSSKYFRNWKDEYVEKFEAVKFLWKDIPFYKDKIEQFLSEVEESKNTFIPTLDSYGDVTSFLHNSISLNYWFNEFELSLCLCGNESVASKCYAFYSHPIIRNHFFTKLKTRKLEKNFTEVFLRNFYGKARKKVIVDVFKDSSYNKMLSHSSWRKFGHNEIKSSMALSVLKDDNTIAFQKKKFNDADFELMHTLDLTHNEYALSFLAKCPIEEFAMQKQIFQPRFEKILENVS